MLISKRKALPALFGAAGVLAWLLAGCSDTSVLPLQSSGQESRAQVAKPAQSPGDANANVTILTRNQPNGPSVAAASSTPLPTTVNVTPERGGVLTGGNEQVGLTTLSIPPGAVARRTAITMVVGANGPVDVKFAPSGLTFNRPVRLQMSYRGADLRRVNVETLKIFYDSARNGWEAIPGCSVDRARETVTGSITHFSRYAIGSDREGDGPG